MESDFTQRIEQKRQLEDIATSSTGAKTLSCAIDDQVQSKSNTRTLIRRSSLAVGNAAACCSSFSKSQGSVGALQRFFHNAKRDVDTEPAIVGADLPDIIEGERTKTYATCTGSQYSLSFLAQQCSMMSSEEVSKQSQDVVQQVDDEQQNKPAGILKQLHRCMLFILTRYIRLLQYLKGNSMRKDVGLLWNCKITRLNMPKSGESLAKRYHDQEQSVINRGYKHSDNSRLGTQKVKDGSPHHGKGPESISPKSVLSKIVSQLADGSKQKISGKKRVTRQQELLESIGSMKKLDSDMCKASENCKEVTVSNPSEIELQSESVLARRGKRGGVSFSSADHPSNTNNCQPVLCRICEGEVQRVHLEDHSHICAIADRADIKGGSVDDRLSKLAEILDRLLCADRCSGLQAVQGESSEIFETCAFNWDVTKNVLLNANRTPSQGQLQALKTRSENMKVRFTDSEYKITPPSGLSMTPRSPMSTTYFDLQFPGQTSLSEVEDPTQISELADIARCVAGTRASEKGVLEYLMLCLRELQGLLESCQTKALTVHTFGKRIERLLREKYLQISGIPIACDSSSQTGKEYDQLVDCHHQLRPSPLDEPFKERTSIEDFEIIKPISRGAFGRVFLARKRTTGDLFAIKILRKVDMIDKNAVQNILAERDILISARNPFVVRFFYSFTCQENLYLVMEYLIGGDLYSLLRNVGRLEESVARIYIAEIVLALEYLHSLGVVHGDLKPENLLIAHDGHVKLTDFGLSKMGILNNTHDLSGPAACVAEQSDLIEERVKCYATGTPDYLAPEILLGMKHGKSVDWWSMGIILFEFLTGFPPFNAEHPQNIFDNILNGKIPWTQVSEEMSCDAKDLICRLLNKDPSLRLGTHEALEVKLHPFFKDVNWDTLTQQKVVFIPNPDNPHDTSYFDCRLSWNDSTSVDILEKSTVMGNKLEVDEHKDIIDSSSKRSSKFTFSNFSFKNLSELATINYDMLMQNVKDEEH